MSRGTCLLCFSITKMLDIKHTQLQNCYEELSDCKIQADSHPLCYICNTKLLQCQQLLKQIQENNRANQAEARPLVELCVKNVDDWSLVINYEEIECQPGIEKEYIKEEYEESPDNNENAKKPVEEPVSRKETTIQDNKPHTCDVCHKKFSYPSLLKIHTQSHTEVKPYSCDVCGKKYTRTSSLKTHKLTHSGEKPYSCEICSREFTTKSMLTKHKLIHTGEKSYTCDVCNKAFLRSYDLTAHKIKHVVEKPYKCDVCGKKFKKSSSLKTHKVMHTGDKPFSCDVCSTTFTAKSSLKKHKLSRCEKTYKRDVHYYFICNPTS